MTLYAAADGTGPDLVLLHGWGLHGGVFDGFAARLAASFRVTRVDLPGHGCSAAIPGTTAAAWAEAVAACVPRPAYWMGWSLGGLIALQRALADPEGIRGLIMLAASPRFVSDGGWPGTAPAALADFAAGLAGDYMGTLRRFLALQVYGSPGQAGLLRPLREKLLQHPPQARALAAGLEILRGTDLRTRLPGLTVPSLWVYGDHDRMAPARAAGTIAALAPAARIRCIAGAGHAPFLSHAAELQTIVEDWLNDQRR